MEVYYTKGEVINNNKVIKLLGKTEYYPYIYLINDHFTAMCNFKLTIVDEFIFLLEKF